MTLPAPLINISLDAKPRPVGFYGDSPGFFSGNYLCAHVSVSFYHFIAGVTVVVFTYTNQGIGWIYPVDKLRAAGCFAAMMGNL